MLLDRLLDSAGLDVVPVALCDVRAGVRVELPALEEAHMHCIVRGGGVLRGGGTAVPLAAVSIALVPANVPHGLSPEGEASRAVRIGGAVSSDHVPALTAGSGDPGLVFACGRIRATQCEGLGLFRRLRVPAVVQLSDAPQVNALLEAVLDEQAGRAPGNRRITALAMQQCLLHALRRLFRDDAGKLPWLAALKDPGFARALDGMLRTPEGPHSAKSLAECASMSRGSFGYRFAQAFGRGPMDFLSQLRLHEAMRLLRTTDLSIDAAAARVGLHASSPVLRQLRAPARAGAPIERGPRAAGGAAGKRRKLSRANRAPRIGGFARGSRTAP